MDWFMNLPPQVQGAIISALVGAIFGIIGGIAGPIIHGKIQHVSDLKKLKFEADLTRQGKMIDAQDRVIADMTKALWKWRYVSIRVTYYANSREDMYDKSRKEYDDNVWKNLNDIRYLITKSRRLVSNETFSHLQDFYKIAVDLDNSISSAAAEGDAAKKSEAFSLLNQYIYRDISQKIDELSFNVGKDFSLSSR